MLQVTDAPIVPPLVLFLAKHPLVDKYDLSRLVRVGCGAAPLSKELEEAMLKRLPNVQQIRQGRCIYEAFCSYLCCCNNSVYNIVRVLPYLIPVGAIMVLSKRTHGRASIK